MSIRSGSAGRRARISAISAVGVGLGRPVVEQDRVELHPVLRAEHRDRHLAIGGEAPRASRRRARDRRDQAALRRLVVDQHQQALSVARHAVPSRSCRRSSVSISDARCKARLKRRRRSAGLEGDGAAPVKSASAKHGRTGDDTMARTTSADMNASTSATYDRVIDVLKWGAVAVFIIAFVGDLADLGASSAMKIAVLTETAEGERRVAATPETVKKFIALGAERRGRGGRGRDRLDRRCRLCRRRARRVGDRAATLAGADIVLGVQGPDPASADGRRRRARGSSRGLNPFARARARRWLCRRRARGAGDGIHAAHHPRAVDGHPVVASRTSPATRRCSTPRPNMAAPSR